MTTKFDSVELKALAGDTETFTFSVTQNAVAVNFSGYSFTATGRQNKDALATLWSKTLVDGSGGCSYGAGVVAFTLDSTTTAALPVKSQYAVRGSLSGAVLTIARGPLVRIDPYSD